MDFERLSVDNAAKLADQSKIKTVQERKKINNEASKTMADTLDEKASAKDVAAFNKATSRKRKNEAINTQEDDKVRRDAALARYSRYFTHKHPALREACGGVAPSQSWTADEAERHLDRVRSSLNSKGCNEMCKLLVTNVAHGAEHVTMKIGFNPRQWDLHDFGDATAEAIEQGELSAEIAEMEAELGPFITVPWYARLATKMFAAAESYSAARKHQRRASSLQSAQPK